jgi:DNA-binding GntR family transcriptional regulator
MSTMSQVQPEPVFENLTLWQRVHEHLQREILDGRLLPGTVLSEVALAKELGVSRGPIREAMGRLAAEGLVTVRPRRGAVVRSPTLEELLEAYQVREVLESLAVRLAVPCLTGDDLQELGGFVDDMEASAKAADPARFFEANVAFHERFCELSGNRKLRQVHRTLMGEIRGYQGKSVSIRGNLSDSVSEHRAILEAAGRGDARLAAELAGVHVRVPAERLKNHLLESGDVEKDAVDVLAAARSTTVSE